jgi:hypothetical protein
MKRSYKDELALPPRVTFDVLWQNDDQVNITAVKAFVATLSRPGWYKHDHDNGLDTRLYMMEVLYPFRPIEIVGKLTRSWTCGACNLLVLYEGLHLGHKNKWRDELVRAGVTTAAEGKAAYNNLRNLRIECAGCNQSHAFE